MLTICEYCGELNAQWGHMVSFCPDCGECVEEINRVGTIVSLADLFEQETGGLLPNRRSVEVRERWENAKRSAFGQLDNLVANELSNGGPKRSGRAVCTK
jgi:hypothetical protein